MASLSRALRVAATCPQGRSVRNLGLQPIAREARPTAEKNVPYQRTLKEEAQGSSVVPQGPSQPLPSTADVVVIGGGSLGCQTLYHLAKLGVGRAVLLERERLTSGTTWHTAGLLWQLRPSDVEVELLAHTRQVVSHDLEQETGMHTGWIQNGGLFIASNRQRLDEYKRLMSLGKAYGVESHVLSPAETKDLYPLMNVDDLYGTLYVPHDGTMDPAGTCTTLTRAAVARGAKVIENCPVTGIRVRVDDFGVRRVAAVETEHGSIQTPCVVNCAGVWASTVGQMAGVKVALVAMHHAYIVTERIEGIQNMPNVRDHDASVYLRLQGDALSVGGYEANPIFWEEVSDKFAFGLFDLDWDVFTQHIEGAINRVPVLEKTGIKSTVCGPESFTPNHKPLMGEAPELRGFFLGCGFNSAGRPKCYSLHLGILPLTMFILVFFGVAVGELDVREVVALSRMVYDQPKALTPRNDVLVMTPWLAPIIWEGTFNTDILNEQFRLQNTTIGLTMFAIKKYVVFLKLFLETAEQHFMVGHKVIYYVFTDRPAEVPQVPLGAGRKLVVLTVRNYSRWQDVSMHRMEMISHFSERRFLHEVDYLVCADVDMKFQDHVGVEILSALFGTLHPGFYRSSREAFTYERRPKSRAYIPRDEGDFYYAGGFFGGSVVEVHHLTKACHQAMVEDKANGIEAVWHDESYLNKYLLYHKPTKVLSPEYVWDQKLLGWPSIMKKLRYVAVPKNHQAIRNR